ncbi:MAG: glycosyltransferase family 9 protein [Gemmatirosa sp.]|nr:glycosyltransferase family 9 protein [Gemmatirosa sp.]
MARRHSDTSPPARSRAPDALAADALAAARRGDLATLGRLERDVLTLASLTPPGDESVDVPVQAIVVAYVRHAAYDRALAFARQYASLAGYDRLAGSELLLLLAAGDHDAARRLAEEAADAPVAFGGHGLRAIVRTLLGRDADAASDGAAFILEAIETGRSLGAWRTAARLYGPATAQVLSRYAALHRELAEAFPASRPWNGESLDGRTVALQLVEGLGDQLQGLRFARAIRDAGGRVLVGCDDRLRELVRASDLAEGFLDRPLPARPDVGPVDFHLVVGGWLHDSGLPSDRWPSAPYLAPADTDQPPAILDGLTRPRIGIAWAGNPDFALESTRGLPYAALRRLVAATPDVVWVSLQRFDHPRARELGATPITRRVVDAGPTLRSMLDTAHLMRHLDLVVATDSAPAHLAGALGVPVWTLLGPTFNWRWRIDGETTPLYPSMRLIREAAPGSWNAAVDRVVHDLAAMTPRRA